MQVANLQFLDVREAQTDVIRFCREAEAAATSLLLAPLEGPVTSDTPDCVEAAAAAGTTLLGAAFRSRQRLLDRIAVSAIAGREKNAMVARSTADIDATSARISTAIADRCSPAAFAAVYRTDAATVLDLIASRADCLAGDAYAQGGVLCPAPACGNRMREGVEECDDGNTADGDGCTADCRREAVTSDSRS
jgi:cysteine-rich repeat protein